MLHKRLNNLWHVNNPRTKWEYNIFEILKCIYRLSFRNQKKYACLFQIQVCTMKDACLSNKERQRRFREKRDNDLVKRAEYLAKRREKCLSGLKDGKRKNIDHSTERKRKGTMYKWKTIKWDYRKKKEIAQQFLKLNPTLLSIKGSGT